LYFVDKTLYLPSTIYQQTLIMKFKCLFVVIVLITSNSLFANSQADSTSFNTEIDEELYMELYKAYTDSVVGSLNYETSRTIIGDDLATIVIPSGFKYLSGADADMVLSELWGNPPPERDEDKSLGMLLPIDDTPMSDSSWVVNITFIEDGYVDDADAEDIDYDELLTTMQADSKESNKMRKEMGYPTVEMIGWAAKPYYDKTNKKLHWAKELNFESAPTNTLNYNIRVLGRRGILQLNAIAEMDAINDVNANINPILSSVNFNEGHRYADFDPDYDKVAAYGVGALITGKILAKAGILAKLGVFLAKFWKLLAVAVIGGLAGIRKLFGKKEETSQT